MSNQDNFNMPTADQLEAELSREKYKHRYVSALRSTIYALLAVSAIAVLIATLWMPILQISGNSMSPTLESDEIVLTMKTKNFSSGDVVAFYFNNKILVKRVIGEAGDWINMDADGTVYVNDEELIEPYLHEKAVGECDIEFPYQVPDGKIFVMGDHRETSIDSRSTAVGCVTQEQVVGKIVFRLWPLKELGMING